MVAEKEQQVTGLDSDSLHAKHYDLDVAHN